MASAAVVGGGTMGQGIALCFVEVAPPRLTRHWPLGFNQEHGSENLRCRCKIALDSPAIECWRSELVRLTFCWRRVPHPGKSIARCRSWDFRWVLSSLRISPDLTAKFL